MNNKDIDNSIMYDNGYMFSKLISNLPVDQKLIYIKRAIIKQSLNCLRLMNSKLKDFNEDFVSIAIENDCPNSLVYVKCLGHYINTDHMNLAIKKNNLNIIYILLSYNIGFDQNSTLIACKYGDISILKCLKDNNATLNSECIYECVKCGKYNMLKYIYSVNFYKDTYYKYIINYFSGDISHYYEIVPLAVKTGRLNCLKILHLEGFTLTKENLENAIIYNNYNIVQYLLDYISIDIEDSYLCTLAAKNGNISILNILYDRGVWFDEDTLRIALKNNIISTISYLIKNKCPCPEDILYICDHDMFKICHNYYILTYPNTIEADIYILNIDIINFKMCHLDIIDQYKVSKLICMYSNINIAKSILSNYPFNIDECLESLFKIERNNLIKYIIGEYVSDTKYCYELCDKFKNEDIREFLDKHI